MNKVIKGVAAAVAALAMIVTPITAVQTAQAYGPVEGQDGRKFYTLKEIEDGALGDKVTFNSIVDMGGAQPYEPNFVSAQKAGVIANDVKAYWNGNEQVDVEYGEEYLIRLYVHNDNAPTKEAKAKDPKAAGKTATNTHVQVSIPKEAGNNIRVEGFVTSDNAIPGRIWDYVDFKGDDKFRLQYVPGSATIYNNAHPSGMQLSDNIVYTAEGAKIGFNTMDGNVPGCYYYANYITIKVRAVYDFVIDKTMRFAGTDDAFTDTLDNVKIGDRIEYRINYKNTTQAQQNDVMIKDFLPNNMVYVGNSTYLRNANHKDDNGGKGMQLLPDGALFTTGINIGNYGANSSGAVYFTAEVVDKDLECGNTALVNWAQGTVNGSVHQDRTIAHAIKVCENTKLPEAGPTVTIGGAVAAGTIVTAAGYFIMSRRAMR